jgi:hexosaminidase
MHDGRGRRARLATLGILTVLAPAAGPATAQQAAAAPDPAPTYAVIPRPVRLTPAAGHFTLTARTVVWTDTASAALGHQLVRALEPATGFALAVASGGTAPASGIVLHLDPALDSLGAEGYVLEVTPTRVLARAAGPAGLFYAVQTVRQLLPPEIFRDAPVGGTAWTIPAVRIEDRPRFAWRGAHLDVVRHFMPKSFVKRYIDLMALHKLNRFHWHLTDDLGWRLEIRKYPKLTGVGAWRARTLVGRRVSADSTLWGYDESPHGGYYTQEDVREIVAYAAARHVTIVPEIEMPGHALAAIAAYPELGVTGQPAEVGTHWGVYSEILNAEPNTVAFMQDVLTEVLALFPGPFIHVGGDEADKTQWKASPQIQARIRQLGLEDEHALQSWFIHQMDDFLTAHGRRLVGWDEILEGGLAPNATVMSWRGSAGGIEAARAGHDVVMAPNGYTYLDYYQTRDVTREPMAIGGFLPLDSVYLYEPMPAELDAAAARHVLGAQAQLWTEYIPGPRNVEYMAYPRLTALAEVVWTPAAERDLADFRRRLAVHLRRLYAMDVNYRAPGRGGAAEGPR